jgi:hypothetical protein
MNTAAYMHVGNSKLEYFCNSFILEMRDFDYGGGIPLPPRHGPFLPLVTDGRTRHPDRGDNSEYTEYSVADSRKGVVLYLEYWARGGG